MTSATPKTDSFKQLKRYTTQQRRAEQGSYPLIVALSSVFPPHTHTQEDYLERFLATQNLSEEDAEFAKRVFRATLIESSCSYLPKERLFEKLSREQYVAYVRPSLLDLGRRAAQAVLEQWGGNPADITHIVWGTMTGTIHAPTLDILLAQELGLRPGIKRLSVENMGCLTGFRCLNLAAEIAEAHTSAKVLVVVCDIRSALQNQIAPHDGKGPFDRSTIVSTALFRDSGGAALVTSAGVAAEGGTPASTQPLFQILDGRSFIIPGTNDLVDYRELEGAAIRLFISKELPNKVQEALPMLAEELLGAHGISVSDCCFALHTGGPKIIKNCAAALGVPEERLGASWHVMRKYGNLSGTSNLVVLDHLWRMAAAGEEGVEEREYCLCVSMGPGVCVELALLRRCKCSEVTAGPLRRQGTSLRIPVSCDHDMLDADMPPCTVTAEPEAGTGGKVTGLAAAFRKAMHIWRKK